MAEPSLFSCLSTSEEERQPNLNYLIMDFPELIKVIFNRIQKFEPENVVKIMGCIFLREPDEHDMMQLAYGSDATVISHINEAKATLSVLSSSFHSSNLSHQFLPHSLNLQNPLTQQTRYHDPFAPNAQQLLNLEEQLESLNVYGDQAANRRKSLVTPKKICHYFIKGMCKNGTSCNYSHQLIGTEAPFETMEAINGSSLEALEMEIVELLRSRRGQPVSIASLPTCYGEMYGKSLQAAGYLTESQRQGKAGYSLTKLLCRLNKIRLIERPHGQHAVVLAEDAAKYVTFPAELTSTVHPSSHQIYLTFPADSTFSEDDVRNYFSQFGPVRDVRIPCQDRRMFGFVSFQNPETVLTILANRHPHFICGARVLVKPYREKAKTTDSFRVCMEKMKPDFFYYPNHSEIDPELFPMPGEWETTMLLKRQLMERQEKLFEPDRMRHTELSLDPTAQSSFRNHSINEFRFSLGTDEFDSIHPFNYALDALTDGSTSENPTRENRNEKESDRIELPENPFGLGTP